MNDAFARERYLKTGMGKRYLNNRLKRFLSLTGQVTLELTIGLIATIIFLLGLTNAWVWFNQSLIERQERYEETRLSVTPHGNYFSQGYQFEDYYTPQPLRILNGDSGPIRDRLPNPVRNKTQDRGVLRFLTGRRQPSDTCLPRSSP